MNLPTASHVTEGWGPRGKPTSFGVLERMAERSCGVLGMNDVIICFVPAETINQACSISNKIYAQFCCHLFNYKCLFLTHWLPGNLKETLGKITLKLISVFFSAIRSLQWRHNDHDCVSNHQPRGCLLNRLFRRRSKKTSKLRVTGLCVGNSPGPVNSPHKGPVTRKMFPFDDVIM